MGKKVAAMNWRSVALEGMPMDGAAMEGFVGLEECTDYDLNSKVEDKRKKKVKKPRKQKEKVSKPTNKEPNQLTHTNKGSNEHTPTSKAQKRPNKPNQTSKRQNKPEQPAAKKIKLSNGFIVEVCNEAKPSTDNSSGCEKKSVKEESKNPTTLKEERMNSSSNTLQMSDMQAWAPFQIPEEILRALAEQGFNRPTKIQELCLPPAVLGRRDILGAAETGSGKTLAFGIPILAGIMKLKEKEQAGQNVYDIPYKKTSVKRNTTTNEGGDSKSKQRVKKKENNRSSNGKSKSKEKENYDVNDEVISDDEKSGNKNNGNEKNYEEYNGNENSHKENSDNDENSGDGNEEEEENDSDDNYIHLSDMLDSDDLGDSSDEDNDKIIDPTGSDDDNDENEESDDPAAAEDGDIEETVGKGIGCIKVVDNIDLPAPLLVKTGRPLYALVIAPTRELAVQIAKHMVQAAKYTGIRIATLVGGMAQVKQERLLAGAPEVVVCTPGRLWEMLQQGNPHLQQVDNIKFLAIDETDRMVERNHFEELQPLLERLNSDERRRSNRQNFVMSATLTMTHALPSHLKGKKVTKRGKIINKKVHKMTPQQKTNRLVTMLGMTDPKIVDLTADNHGKAGTLTECRITCALEQKDYYLYYILRTYPGRSIVFCNSIGCVKRLAQLFSLLKCRPLPLHAAMPQRQRLKNLDRFREDPLGVLVATDVAARGLDIPDVDHVIHYQVPRTAENYVHRSGRTARANKAGLTILMMEPGEALLYSKLCRTLDRATELTELPVTDAALASVKAAVSLAREVEARALVGKRRAQEAGWLDRAARECDLIVDEDFVPMKKKLSSEDAEPAAKALQLKRRQLDSLLGEFVFPRVFSLKHPALSDGGAVHASEDNALRAVQRALQSRAGKKHKRRSKNAALLDLHKLTHTSYKKLAV